MVTTRSRSTRVPEHTKLYGFSGSRVRRMMAAIQHQTTALVTSPPAGASSPRGRWQREEFRVVRRGVGNTVPFGTAMRVMIGINMYTQHDIYRLSLKWEKIC